MHRDRKKHWYTIIQELNVLSHIVQYSLHQIMEDVLLEKKVISATEAFEQKVLSKQRISEYLCTKITPKLCCHFDKTMLWGFFDDYIFALYMLTTPFLVN